MLKTGAVMLIILLITGGCFQSPLQKPFAEKVRSGVIFEGIDVSNLSRSEIEKIVINMSNSKNVTAKNAFFSDNGDIILEKYGQKINIDKTINQVMMAPANSKITAVADIIYPAIIAKQLEEARIIGKYSTLIMDNSKGRLNNIRLTARLISNQVLEPGERFSFNKIVGEPTEERGFEPALVIVNKSHEMEVGGGMCQVSSTLYNAVLAAKLPVIERHPHSQPVAYVPVGQDATIYTDKDFQFENNTHCRVIIKAFVKDNSVMIVELLQM